MNMVGKTVLITGSTDGVGRYVAAELAKEGARVLIHGRDASRAKALIDEIVGRGGARPAFYQADLSSFAGARQLASAVAADHTRLDVFISNAGIGSMNGGPERRTSADGHELRFAVNYLSGFLLIYLLLPLIKAEAPSRIVNVASLGQHPIDFDDVMITKNYSPSRACAAAGASDQSRGARAGAEAVRAAFGVCEGRGLLLGDRESTAVAESRSGRSWPFRSRPVLCDVFPAAAKDGDDRPAILSAARAGRAELARYYCRASTISWPAPVLPSKRSGPAGASCASGCPL